MEMKRLIHTCIELGGREGGRGWERMRRLNEHRKVIGKRIRGRKRMRD